MTRNGTGPDTGPDAEANRLIAEMRAAVTASDAHWFHALLEAIGLWPLPEEQVAGRTFHYLVGGEAFDWLLLAERLCDELQGLIPEDEAEELLFHGRPPVELTEDDFRGYLGTAKHRAHLNFVYGVQVEDALQLAVRSEVRKEHLTRVWENGQTDDEVFRRIYGATRAELLARFHEKTDKRRSALAEQSAEAPAPEGELSLAGLTEFTYWLFRHRVDNSDPARVASDTRKGVALLQHLDALRRRGARVTIDVPVRSP